MTVKEKVISSAYTGISFVQGNEEFSEFHKYLEELLGRPVWTHELANKELWEQIKERAKPDFLAMLKG